MSRVFNFSAGPAALPEAVLAKAQSELLDWNGAGMSVMEMSHRGKEFVSIAAQAEADLRELMAIPDNYKVLFLQGGASGQFAGIPLNLGAKVGDYVITGSWGKKAHKEAGKYITANVVAKAEPFTSVPPQSEWNLSPDADFLHITPNETIEGVEFPFVPEVDVPVVADFSSTILSRPIDVSKYGVIYAGAQKNIGPSGLVLVIVREDLLGKADPKTPMVWDWQQMADNDSMLNTPPCYGWYMCGLVFQWLKENGGLEKMAEINERKAKKLYDAIDASDFYANPVAPECRSWMNVPFTLANADLDAQFLAEAKEAGLVTLKGHRSVGGMRASIYNAMPEAGVDALISFMADFETRNA
jgi:phosphoserine aminotransferase